MMKIFIDFFPIILFFITFKFAGIYAATGAAIFASLGQVLYHRLKHKCFDKTQVISFLVIFILGGATLFFRNPLFIKWKPTGIYWISALVFLLSNWFGSAPLIKKMMGSNLNLPQFLWYRLNYAWVLFFILMGGLNLFIAYHYDTNTWVNFKLFGSSSLTFIFILLQGLYIYKYLPRALDKPVDKNMREENTL